LLSRVFGAGRDGDESVGRIPLDSPPVVVGEHVVVSAEQDAVVDVGAPAFGDRNDVVTLTPRDRPVASGEAAPSVAGGEGFALPGAEEALLDAEPEGLLGIVSEFDGQNAGVAHRAGGGLDGHGFGLVADERDPRAGGEVAGGDEHPHRVSFRAQDAVGVDLATDAHQADERVEGDLTGRPRVGGDRIGRSLGLGVDEPRPPRRGEVVAS
jgi:hypothetical protein